MSKIRDSDVLHYIKKQDNGQVPVQVDAILNVHQLDTTSLSEASERFSIGKAGTEIKGHLFEFKLLMLFMVRAISADYQFEFTCNNESIGGKFDDIVFRYEVPDDPPSKGKHWRYRYVQAKHKVDRTALSIKSSHLLSTSKKDEVNDYSLLKYFKSYCKIKARGDDIQDCVICTTIDFDYKNMDGIILRPVDIADEKILTFEVNNQAGYEKSPVLYKLELNKSSKAKLFEMDDIRILAQQLKICAAESRSPTLKQDIFNKYHVALVKENILDLNSSTPKVMKLHKDFVDNVETLSNGAKDLRQILIELGYKKQDLAKWKFQRPGSFGQPTTDTLITTLPHCITDDDITDFCDKFVFVVNSPSEDELDAIIRNDVSKYYDLNDVENQFLRFSNKILEWFKSVEKSEWFSSKIGTRFLFDEITKISTNYRDKLVKELGFNHDAITNLAKELNNLVNSPKSGQVMRVSTQFSRWTAAKVISAIETWPKYKTSCDESYWVTTSNCLLNKEGKELWANRLKTVKNSRHLLLVVDEDQTASENDQNIVDLIPFNPAYKNKVIIISTRQGGEIKDEINFGDLNEETRTQILSKTISFQGSSETLGNLILCSETDKVIDYFSIKELMDESNKSISIPSFDTSDFEKSLYIERQILCPFQEQLMSELIKEINCKSDKWNGECTVDEKGKITWFTTDEKKKSEIWEKMKVILDRNKSADKQSQSLISENGLLDEKNFRVIITGVAGTGKSSVLSHYYEKLKSKKPDCWVIKISLTRYSQTFLKSAVVDPKSAIDFIVNFPAVGANQSPFAQSLLRHRLNTGDRIILMFDGFDEIETECQDKVNKLINNLNENISIFVTTRPHMADKLQLELSQLAYNLVKFGKQDQIKFMNSVWSKGVTNEITSTKEKEIQEFATKLIDRISKTLNDDEKNFLGIPLQCKILAECFHSKVQAIFQEGTFTSIRQSLSSLLEDSHHFDLASLYKLLIDTKRKEKFKFQTDNHLINYFVEITNKQLERHLTKLAIKTIIQNKEHADILWPVHPHYLSEKDCEHNENNLDKLGVDLGLLTKQNKENTQTDVGENGVQFIHRTYAEYLVADYIYKGFHLDVKSHNKLLESKDSCYAVWQILAANKYDGVQVFLSSMFKEWVTYVSEERRHRKDGENNTRNFPKHLQEFANFFIEYKSKFLLLLAKHVPSFILEVERRENNVISNFVLHCLEETFTRSTVRAVIFREIYELQIAYIILQLDNQLFQTLLAYNDDTNDDEWNKFFLYLCNVNEPVPRKQILCWDQELPQKNIKLFLDFIGKHHNRLTKLLKSRDENSQEAISNMIKFLIQNTNGGKTEQFYNILLSTSFHDTFFVISLIKKAIYKHYVDMGPKGKTLDTLNFLQHLGLNNENRLLFHEIYIFVLQDDSATFQHFYQQYRRLAKAEFNANSIDSVTATDLFGMTQLHHAILNDDIQNVERILHLFRDMSPYEIERLELINLTIDSTESSEKVDFSPIRLAFLCCNEKICGMILSFFKRALPTEKFQVIHTQDGCHLNIWTRDAIWLENKKMFYTILKSMRTFLGFEVLVDVLKLCRRWWEENFEYMESEGERVKGGIIYESGTCWLLKIIADVIIQDDETHGYEELNRFIFSDDAFLQLLLKYGENDILQKVIATQGFDNWTTYILERFKVKAFWFLSAKSFLTGLDDSQRYKLVDIVTTVSKQEKSKSYWAECIYEKIEYAINFMKRTSEIFHENEDVVKKLLFHVDNSGVVLIRNMLFNDKVNTRSLMICLSPELEEEFVMHWITIAQRYINNELERLEEIENNNLLSFLLFYLRYANRDQLSKFVHVIRTTHSLSGRTNNSFFPLFSPDLDKMKELMHRISDKLGENAVKDFILQDNGLGILKQNPLLLRMEEMFAHLSNEKRDEIRYHVLTKPGMIANMLRLHNLDHWVGYYLPEKMNSRKTLAINVLEGFNVLVIYFLDVMDVHQLRRFIQLITRLKTIHIKSHYSVWRDYIDQACHYDDNKRIGEEPIRKFMESVVKKLPNFSLEELTHNKNNGVNFNLEDSVIHRAALSGNVYIFEALISQFDEKKQQEIRQISLERLTTVQNVWNTNGPENLTRFYLFEDTGDLQNEPRTSKIVTGFNILISSFIGELKREQLSRWIEFILSVNKCSNNCSIWCEFIRQLFLIPHSNPTQNDLHLLKKFFHCIERRLGKQHVSQLLHHQDVNGVIVNQIIEAHSIQIVDEILEYLSDEVRLEFRFDHLYHPNSCATSTRD